MTLQDLLTKDFGVTVQEENAGPTISVGSSAVQLLKNNPGAVALVLINLGSTDIYIWTTNDVSAAKGILIAANGGNIFLTYQQYFTLVSSEWYAISPSGTVNVAIKRMEIS